MLQLPKTMAGSQAVGHLYPLSALMWAEPLMRVCGHEGRFWSGSKYLTMNQDAQLCSLLSR